MEEKATTIEERFMNEQEICKGERIDTDPMHLGIVKIKDILNETIGVLKIGRKTLEFHIVGGLGCYVLLYDGCTIKYINKKLKLKEWKTHKKMVTDLDIKFFETLDQAYTNGVYLTINEIYNDIILYVYEDIETVKLKNGIVPMPWLNTASWIRSLPSSEAKLTFRTFSFLSIIIFFSCLPLSPHMGQS